MQALSVKPSYKAAVFTQLFSDTNIFTKIYCYSTHFTTLQTSTFFPSDITSKGKRKKKQHGNQAEIRCFNT